MGQWGWVGEGGGNTGWGGVGGGGVRQTVDCWRVGKAPTEKDVHRNVSSSKQVKESDAGKVLRHSMGQDGAGAHGSPRAKLHGGDVPLEPEGAEVAAVSQRPWAGGVRCRWDYSTGGRHRPRAYVRVAAIVPISDTNLQ